MVCLSPDAWLFGVFRQVKGSLLKSEKQCSLQFSSIPEAHRGFPLVAFSGSGQEKQSQCCEI